MTDNGNGWRNRIVDYGVKRADQFQAHPANWRQHPKHQRAALAASLNGVGWVGVVLENVRTGHLLDGHERLWQALERGDETPVPFIQVDVDEDEEMLVLATLDPIGAMAQTDAEMLEGILADLRASELVQDDAALDALLHSIAAQADVAYGAYVGEDAPEPQLDRTEELRELWQTERGQVWEIPSASVPGRSHRLMCGDSTSAEDVARLMRGEKADMALTDPPYAIYGSSTGIGGDVTDDNMVRPFMRDVLLRLIDSTPLGAHVYVHCDWRSYASWWDVAKNRPLVVRNCIVWDKGDGGLGSMYTMRHEFIVFFERLEKAVIMTKANQGRNARLVYGLPNVQRFNVPQHDDRNHNAAKPPELLAVLIGASSDEGGTVLDLFVGSGTTFVAAEQTGRVCYGMEIEPKYVAVTLQRLADMGLAPVLVNAV